MSYQCISIEQAKALVAEQAATLLDIRDPGSYQAGHIQGAVLVSNDNVQEIIDTADKSQPLIIYCYHGNSSKNAADYFFQAGFEQSYSVDGGYEQWKLQL